LGYLPVSPYRNDLSILHGKSLSPVKGAVYLIDMAMQQNQVRPLFGMAGTQYKS
jgi:hypothetical protein